MNKVIKNKSINLKKVQNPYVPFEVKLASVPKTPYAPFKIGDPKGHGTEMINTGFEWTMMNQASTTRANTIMFNLDNAGYNAWRASDSYPLAVYYGSIYYNATGAAWKYDSAGVNDFIPNAPAQQIEIACKNIEADIIAGMYTDLVITNYSPKYPNNSAYPTSIFVRYIKAAIFNSKAIISAIKKFSQFMAINEYLSNVSALFVNRSNILVTAVSRRSFIASMELLNAALKQIPIHKDVWKSYSGLWNVSFDPSKLNSAFTYVVPSIYDYSGEDYPTVSKFCTISETDTTDNPNLILSEEIVKEIEGTSNTEANNLPTVGMLISNFLENDDSTYQTWVTDAVDRFNKMFRKLALAIAAMSQAFQPFIVAMIRVGDKYFSDVLERNPDLRSLIQSKFVEFKDFEIMGMVRPYAASISTWNNDRTMSMVVPLFNSFTPIDMFRKNGVLMCKGSDTHITDPSQSYTAIIDVSDLWPHTMHFWNQCTYDNTHGLFQKTARACNSFPGKHFYMTVGSDLVFESNFKISPYAITDLGTLQYLQKTLVSFTLNAESGSKQTYHYNPDLCGFRFVTFEPVLDKLMERAPYVFGVNSELAKAIKA